MLVAFLENHGIDCRPGRRYTERQAGRIVHEAMRAGLDQARTEVETEEELGVEFDFSR